MIPQLTERDIVAACGRTYAERGRAYQRSGRVLEVEWDAEERTLIGVVSGSGRNVYQQEIPIDAAGRGYRIEGYCSCPMEENCKHVAAVLFAWVARHAAPPALPRESGRTRPQKKPSPVQTWQQRVAALLAPPPAPKQSSARTPAQALVYVLNPEPFLSGTRLVLRLLKCRQLQRGGWGKPAAVAWQQLVGYSSWGYGYGSEWLDGRDREIVDLLRKGFGSQAELVLSGDLGGLILKRLLQTGRCYLENFASQPLVAGPRRRAAFQWQDAAAGGTALQVALEEVEPGWLAVPTDPPWYIDPTRGLCGPIEQPLEPRLFHALCHLPPVPAAEREALGRFLFPLIPPRDLPLPFDLKMEKWQEPPAPGLLLHGLPGPSGELVHCARLQFDYGPCRLPPWQAGDELEGLHRQQGRDWLIRRDSKTETAALQALRDLGFSPAGQVGVGAPGEWDLVFTARAAGVSAARWRSFLQQELPRLQEQGWRIEVAESFRLNFARAQGLAARIEDGGGWFDIGLDLEHQGRRIPLLPLLVQFLEEGVNLADGVLLSLGDGEYLEVPSTVLEPILGTLIELYQRPGLGAAGQLRLPRTLAPWLDELAGRLEEGGVDLAWQGGEEVRRLAQRLRDFAGIAEVAPPPGLQAELRPYQRQGLSWLQFLREYGFGGILADDMGLGKTVQTLAHLLAEQAAGRLDRPALVVAPTSVLGNWRREAARFAPGLRVLVLHGPERSEHFQSLGDYHLIVTSYALLLRDVEVLGRIPLHSLILDEAQAIKNARAKVAQAACALQADQRLCLTGTPLENHLGELWSLFHFLMPGFLGAEGAFNTLFRQPIERRGDGERRRELVRRITPFVLRRDKSAVAKELPPKSEIVQSVELDGPQRRLYETIRAAMAAKISALLQEKGVARSHIEMLDALLKLRQACCDPRLVKLESARGARSSAKLELLLEMLVELLEEGRRVLVFSQFTSMLALIEEELGAREIPYVKLTGQTRKRDEVVARFQGGDVPLFLISLKAGGVGLNLTAADTVIHYDPWWNPAVERQATDRAHRIGQDKPVFVYKLVAADTVEEKILQLQERKQALADDIYRKEKGGDELAALSAEEILSLFAP